MCVCVRARACARLGQFLTSGIEFLEMRILLGFTPVVTFGIFWLLAKPVKFYMRAYMVWWNWIWEFEIIKFWINSRGYTMRRNWRNEKFSENKILTCRDWVIILRTIYTTWTLDHNDYSGLLINLPYQTNKNTFGLLFHSPGQSFIPLRRIAGGTWFSEIVIIGIRYVFDLFTESL